MWRKILPSVDGGRAEGLACKDPGVRTPIGASGNFIDYFQNIWTIPPGRTIREKDKWKEGKIIWSLYFPNPLSLANTLGSDQNKMPFIVATQYP